MYILSLIYQERSDALPSAHSCAIKMLHPFKKIDFFFVLGGGGGGGWSFGSACSKAFQLAMSIIKGLFHCI